MKLVDKTMFFTGSARRIYKSIALAEAHAGVNVIIHQAVQINRQKR